MSFVCVQLLKKKIHEFGNSLQEDLHPKHCTKRVQYPPWAVDCICRSARIRTFSTCVEYPANIGERYQATTQRSRCPKKGIICIPVSCRDISEPMEPAAPVIKIRLPRSMLPMASISISILSLGRIHKTRIAHHTMICMENKECENI